jgi:hypothetical protein
VYNETAFEMCQKTWSFSLLKRNKQIKDIDTLGKGKGEKRMG